MLVTFVYDVVYTYLLFNNHIWTWVERGQALVCCLNNCLLECFCKVVKPEQCWPELVVSMIF